MNSVLWGQFLFYMPAIQIKKAFNLFLTVPPLLSLPSSRPNIPLVSVIDSCDTFQTCYHHVSLIKIRPALFTLLFIVSPELTAEYSRYGLASMT